VTEAGIVDDAGPSHFLFSFVDQDTGRHAWFTPWTPDSPACEPLPVESAGGPLLFFNCGTAGYLGPAGGTAEPHVVSGDAVVIDGSASSFHDLVVWSERGSPGTSRIRAWSAATGTRTLIDSLPGLVCGVSVSADRIVGWSIPADHYCNAVGPGLQLWHASRGSDGTVVAVQQVPALGAGELIPDLFTSRNGYATFSAVLKDSTGAESQAGVVVRLSDGMARRITPQPGYQIHVGTVEMTERHVYWAEGKHVSYDDRVSVVLRHELSQFDTLGEPL
jgi:hypothetical protein